MTRRSLMRAGTGVAFLILVGGCAQQLDTSGAAPRSLTSAPIDAAMVTSEFGWVLTAGDVLLTDDSGKSFRAADLKLPVGLARAAFFIDRGHGWVASIDGETVTVARTTDGGETWTSTNIKTGQQIGAVTIGFGNATHGALLATVQTSAAFSGAEMYVTTDGGASWGAATAPVAGRIAVEPSGRIWLAGGVQGDQLYASTDRGRTWSQVKIGLAASAVVEAVAPPAGGVVPVTVTQAGTSRVALLTSTDQGASWREAGSVALKGDTASAIPVAVRDSTVVVVADPSGNRLHRVMVPGASGQLAVAGGDGLPAGVSRVSFGDPDAGWALASSGRCANGKQDCSIVHSLMATNNGGYTWHQLLHFEERLS